MQHAAHSFRLPHYHFSLRTRHYPAHAMLLLLCISITKVQHSVQQSQLCIHCSLTTSHCWRLSTSSVTPALIPHASPCHHLTKMMALLFYTICASYDRWHLSLSAACSSSMTVVRREASFSVPLHTRHYAYHAVHWYYLNKHSKHNLALQHLVSDTIAAGTAQEWLLVQASATLACGTCYSTVALLLDYMYHCIRDSDSHPKHS
eukprot:15914-Heterococcus_DN1.PRE.3